MKKNQRKKGQRLPGSVNWDKLHIEFLGSDSSLNQLKIKHKLNDKWFYKQTAGWQAERATMHQRALELAKGTLEKDLKDEYSQYAENVKKLVRAANAQAAALYQQTLGKDGTIKKPLNAMSLKLIADMVSANLKTFRIIEGKTADESDPAERYFKLLIQFMETDKPRPIPDAIELPPQEAAKDERLPE